LNPLRQSKTPGQGAATEVWAATSPLLKGAGGLYLENCNVAPIGDTLKDVDLAFQTDPRGFSGVKSWAINAGNAEKLWALSEKLTGVKFPFERNWSIHLSLHYRFDASEFNFRPPLSSGRKRLLVS
jgi:hypothetical protein